MGILCDICGTRFGTRLPGLALRETSRDEYVRLDSRPGGVGGHPITPGERADPARILRSLHHRYPCALRIGCDRDRRV